MKILITGSTGLLGQALIAHLAPRGDVTGLSRHAPSTAVAGVPHVVCDLLDAEQTRHVFDALRPEAVIHAQAQPNVDRCELEPEETTAQNVRTTAHVVDATRRIEAFLVHLSTDYVFDGMKGSAYSEDDAPNPINVYGRSKLEAERLVLEYPRSMAVRTSTLFGSGRMNFCDRIVQELTAGRPVEAFVDQVTSPTYAGDLAEGLGDLCQAILEAHGIAPRILHMVNTGECSRLVFADRVRQLLRGSPELIRPIPLAQWRGPAQRPRYSALISVHLLQLIGRRLRPWDDALQAYLQQRHWLN